MLIGQKRPRDFCGVLETCNGYLSFSFCCLFSAETKWLINKIIDHENDNLNTVHVLKSVKHLLTCQQHFFIIFFTAIVSCHLSFHPLWQFMVSEINLLQELINTLLFSYTSSVKLWLPLRVAYTTWLSCDKPMNCESFQKDLFCSDSIRLCLREISLCCSPLIILSLSVFLFAPFVFSHAQTALRWGKIVSLE